MNTATKKTPQVLFPISTFSHDHVCALCAARQHHPVPLRRLCCHAGMTLVHRSRVVPSAADPICLSHQCVLRGWQRLHTYCRYQVKKDAEAAKKKVGAAYTVL
jgi:hypothetical protein